MASSDYYEQIEETFEAVRRFPLATELTAHARQVYILHPTSYILHPTSY